MTTTYQDAVLMTQQVISMSSFGSLLKRDGLHSQIDDEQTACPLDSNRIVYIYQMRDHVNAHANKIIAE